MRTDPDIESLAKDIFNLLRGFSSQVTSMECLTTLPNRLRTHATFKVRFEDGRVIKARQVATAEQVDRICAIRRTLPDAHFPKILAHGGSALIEEWVDGLPVDSRNVPSATLRKGGQLLGLVHRAHVSEFFDPRSPTSPPKRLARLERQSQELVERGALSGREMETILDLAQAHMPETNDSGIIHRDFCAENLIVGGDGALRAIDNETMQHDAFDFDLARTWYRWPMEPVQWSVFLRGYRALRPTIGFERHALFWCLSALIDTFLYRVEAATADPELPYRRIRTLLHEHADA